MLQGGFTMANSSNTAKHVPFFDEIDPMEKILFILEAILFIPTFTGNILILVSIYRYRWLQSPLNTLIANLAVSDLLVSVGVIPLDVLGTFLGMHRYIELCLVSIALMLTFLLMSIFSMLAISVERFYSVTYPLQHRTPRTRRAVNISLPVGWTTAVVISVIPLLDIKKYKRYRSVDSLCKMHLIWKEAYLFVVDTLIVVILIANVVFFSLVVRVALKKLHDNGEESSRMRRKLAKTYGLILVSATFVVCWAPYCIISLYNILTPRSFDVKDAQGWTLLLGFCNSSLNWLIYGLKNDKFRRAFKLILCRRRLSREISEPTDGSS